MQIRLTASVGAVAAVIAFAVVPAAAQAAPHWYKGKETDRRHADRADQRQPHVQNAACDDQMPGERHRGKSGTRPPGGPGEDLMTAFNLSACKVTVGSCGVPEKGSTPAVVAVGAAVAIGSDSGATDP